nr:MAG TPA: Sporulation initiation factor Spo0A C terminal [Herelleviridae sp.]
MAKNIVLKPLTTNEEITAEINSNVPLFDKLVRLGVTPSLKGFRYVMTAVRLIKGDYLYYLDSITKNLYPDIATVWGTNPARVERSIRHLVEVLYTQGSGESITELDALFGNCYDRCTGKPTNSEFLAVLGSKF